MSIAESRITTDNSRHYKQSPYLNIYDPDYFMGRGMSEDTHVRDSEYKKDGE